MYDWGMANNMKLYHDTHPPAYNLRKITVPTALFWSQNDWLAQKEVSSNLFLPQSGANTILS